MKTKTLLRDVAALNIWVNLHSKVNYWTLLLTAAALTYFFVVPHLNFENQIKCLFTLVAVFSGIIVIIILLCIPIMIFFILSNYLIKGALGEKSILVDANGILEKYEKKETSIPWSTVRNLVYTPKHIFIRISMVKFVVLPLRDFENKYEFAKYFSELVRLRDGSS